jgi:hypothetical protein
MQSRGVAEAAKLAKELQALISGHIKPPSETAPSATEPIVYMAMMRGTRGYLEKLAHQINGTYASGWYDACAVMIRRLAETLIIEAFEAHKLEAKIKDASGDYFMLRDLIDRMTAEASWTLGRNAKKALPKLKDVGDKSAHSRRFIAHREDIDAVLLDLRVVVQELLYLARLK